MSLVRRLILVTADHHPLHKYFMTLSDRVASELKVDREVRYEDYLFLIEHGDTDELGMAWVPQLLAELSDGRIVLLLSRVPFDAQFKPDLEKGYEEVMDRLRSLGGQ